MTAEITRGCTSGYFLDALSAQKPYSRIYYSKNIIARLVKVEIFVA
jgi:hypothetical protein